MAHIMVIFAHPDDEGAIAGTLAKYAAAGHQLSLICTTRGEAGEVSDPALATPQNIGQVREKELRCACDALGIQTLHFMGYRDSGMEGAPENEDPRAFVQADPDKVKQEFIDLMRSTKADVVITFEPFGWYGHPDHVFTSKWVTEAFMLMQNGESDGWQPTTLYHAAFLRDNFRNMIKYAQDHGIDVGDWADMPFDGDDPMEEQVTHGITIVDFYETKNASMMCHRTQFGEDHMFRQIPTAIMKEISPQEFFIQVYPSPTHQPARSGDLLTGH